MPTAVLDLDLHHLPPADLDLPGYQRALVLIRYKVAYWQNMAAFTQWQDQHARMQAPTVYGRRRLLLAALMNDYLGWDERNDRDWESKRATIAICTRNRTEDLRRCLIALTRLPDDGQEIIVIDNHPSDDSTRLLVAEFEQVRYVLEPKAGLDIARNRALMEAKNELVAL
jgi:hypothetical protein